MPGILGKKIGMTRVFQDDGRVIPITVVQCEANEITQIKTAEKDGYPAIVLGFSKLKKPTKTKKFRYLKEFETQDTFNKGDKITLEILKDIATVKVTGISKGKGFQGVMKKYNFRGGPASHGSCFHRKPGSIGTCAKPGRVDKGKKLPGHMGSETISLRNVSVIHLDIEKNLIGLKGPIPGANGSLIIIQKIA